MTNEEKLVSAMEKTSYDGYVAMHHKLYGDVYSYVYYNIMEENLYFLEDLEDDFNAYSLKWFMPDDAIQEMGNLFNKR